MSLAFPGLEEIHQLQNSHQLEKSLQSCSDELAVRLKDNHVRGLGKFCEGYLYAANRIPDVSSNAQVHKTVKTLVLDQFVLSEPSPEMVWDIVGVYGPSDIEQVASYLNRLPEDYHAKLAKVVNQVAKDEPLDNLDELKPKLKALYSSSFVEMVDPAFLDALAKQSSLGAAMSEFSSKAVSNADEN